MHTVIVHGAHCNARFSQVILLLSHVFTRLWDAVKRSLSQVTFVFNTLESIVSNVLYKLTFLLTYLLLLAR